MLQKLINKILKAKKDNLPFVVYKKPGKQEVKGLFQSDDQLYDHKDFQASGFVFAPFDNTTPGILFPEKKCEIFRGHYTKAEIVDRLREMDISVGSKKLADTSNAKKEHMGLVSRGIRFLQEKGVAKVVLSRKEEVALMQTELSGLFLRMVQKYPEAFVYVWFHPRVGLWMGATPETLLEVANSQFHTMALAGTQKYHGDMEVHWGEKEITEQQLVTDYILSQCNFGDITVGNPFTKRAGSLLHICTEISGKIATNEQLRKLVKALHPTPAVCGLPKDKAKAFILENETYHRAFYTGYLGEIQMENITSLFVNLRCMQMKNQKMSLYVGGGITKDSDPESEWLETVAKAEVMQSVLLGYGSV